MDRNKPIDRKTAAKEPPPEGHHDAHEQPRGPYGKEEQMQEEQLRQHEYDQEQKRRRGE